MPSFFDVHSELNRRPQKEPSEALTVTAFTAQIKSTLKSAFPATLAIRGEISNFKGANHSGHLYFSLKDAGAVLPVVMFAGAARGLKAELRDGLEVIVTGRIDLYEQGGRYNFILSTVTPVGTGQLELAYRELYARLEQEGLFAPERKRPIPPYPRSIALITSKAAAGLQDQLKVLRRFPFLRLIVVHVPVQGEGAAGRIAAAIDGTNKVSPSLGGIDLILLGRGGGSFEDLFEFSREEVARAVARSAIPIITGIGHEVDTAIADLVADHHAHTPTEAATYAVRMWKLAPDSIDSARARLQRHVAAMISDHTRHLDGLLRHPFFSRPDEIVERRHLRVDDLEKRFELSTRARLLRLRQRLDAIEGRLSRHDPRRVLSERRETLFRASSRLGAAFAASLRRLDTRTSSLASRLDRSSPTHRLGLEKHRLAGSETRLRRAQSLLLQSAGRALTSAEAQLRVLGPDSVLARGFSITMLSASGRVLRSPGEVRSGDELTTRTAAGEVRSTVIASDTPPAP